uniref:Uncharacterized protein n=1 Tax=Caenorhabditis japonica TaxID=281687 RepID=A0A8R1IEW5_CAEJA
MHGIEQRLLKMEPCEPVTQMLAKIAGARAANRTVEEFFEEWSEHELRSLTGFLPHHPNVFVDKEGKEIAPKKSNTQHRHRHHPYARPEPIWRV